MINSYEEAIHWISSRLRFGIKPGLDRMNWVMNKLGNPERNLKVVHVGGTNGKGSTVTYIRSILNEAGKQVGTFTSPYIEEFNERISVNGKPIADDEIVHLVTVIKPLAEELEMTNLGSLTEFEIITCMAIYYFGEVNPVDFTIFEVGLGGRLDSTNILSPILTVITNIGWDHMNILGNTISEIATEKAGIMKEGIPLITAAAQEDALKVFYEKARQLNVTIFEKNKDFIVSKESVLPEGEQFSFTHGALQYNDLAISMLGVHQIENASLAVMAAVCLSVSEEHIRNGLKKGFWPGRMEVLHKNPLVLVDGAHNPEGVRAMRKAVQLHYASYKKKIVFAALRDKDLTDMFKELKQLDGNYYFTEFDYERASSAEQLLEKSGFQNATAAEDYKSLLKELLKDLKEEEMLVISGSLYFISEVKHYMKKILF
ncbi:bifunctional folylpolyglutamate synthase/dihydrofolate synthase [Heyndrickxia acidicola]|uniref:tetrahydrofolate synthase n=1 Tax=Heyndrickxia acidicola TaxID=209389 RepID=A0ABU6MJG6_9BACI|nr:folylpolyglutamate synthase/dihydrofolate synthase family protein [Heyndrickxia acidicola]MED1204814.1 bifunctional folylpolyglutamate synthase/dihydrofolate synthase [Heyndrickxia acidicola]